MKQINFSHEGGFPLEQETLERLQNAYRTELFGALKAHFGVAIGENCIIAEPTANRDGWAIVHDEKDFLKEGVLYPIRNTTVTGYLKTIRTGTNLVYGTGRSQTAYFDFEAVYIELPEYTAGKATPEIDRDDLKVRYYQLKDFRTIKDIPAVERILKTLQDQIDANKEKILKATEDIAEINKYFPGIKTDVTNLKSDVINIKKEYLPIDGSKAMTGNLTVEGKVYLKQTGKENPDGSILLLDSSNQVIKSDTIISHLLDRVTELEKKKPAESAIPKGMIAIWGRPANQIPEGWQEYAPLRGRMPVGFDHTQSEFNEIEKPGGAKNKTLTIDEIPSHRHAVGLFSGTGSTGSEDWISEPYEEDARRAGNYSAPEGGGQRFSILNPYSVVHFIEYTGLPNNTTKPEPPTNLIVTKATSSSVSLSWTKATGNVEGYLLSIDGGDLISSDDIDNHTITDLSPERPYTFTVFAQDTAGNISDGSTITKVTPRVIPVPQSLRCRIEQNEVIIEWDHVTSYTPITYLLVRKIEGIPGSNATFAKTSSNLRTDFFGNYAQMYTHHYKVQALGEDGNESEFSAVVAKNVYPYDPNCFDVESLVTMASGQTKKLKNIVIGDKLQGFSFPNEIDESEGDYMTWNGKLNEAAKAEVTVTDKRTSIQPNYYEIKTPDTTIKVTGEHPLLVTEDGENLKWTRAKDAQQTMLLIDKLGKTIPIESIVFKEEPLEVALLDVENVDNYVISGIVAHNTKVDPLE
ncbi:fibronectin type III domain-containing protein [Flavobacterium sp. WG21]|uniref:fibronectin type III domain-containing protein n=1 Tax=Flavobacterium sp. WG21 TaxID=1229487 RepID=UPI00034CD2B5|nr:fibronectin type III domain-containing protein [Flavobacterium sp. WG21]